MNNSPVSNSKKSQKQPDEDPLPRHARPHDGMGAVLAAFLANVGIGISKFVAFILTGSSAMLAEAVHSVADSSNQVLLYLGSRKAKKAPTRDHPFGFGRAHFLYAFMVSIVLFSLGGAFAVFEGVEKIMHPKMIDAPIVAYVVLIISIILEGSALRTALKEAKTFKPKGQDWWEFLRRTKSVNHIVLALEDSAALIGLSFALLGITLSIVTANPVFDGIATLFIGLLLASVAVILFREVQSLLIGESVNVMSERTMKKIAMSVDNVNQVVDLKTLYTGPSEIFIAMKITVDEDEDVRTVSRAIDEIEAKLRHTFPIARLIYIEPDFYKSKKEQKLSDEEIKEDLDLDRHT